MPPSCRQRIAFLAALFALMPDLGRGSHSQGSPTAGGGGACAALDGESRDPKKHPDAKQGPFNGMGDI
jgi:hypothetical protein